ncbi:MAG: adenylyl-sulfate kinase [Rhizomicrobium sp.]|nr:adenylyl-sulfate kinase [Rhizomicrobium sp.]
MNQAGRVIWITGLSGAGKSTLAALLQHALQQAGQAVILLDGDEVRSVMPLGDRFDREARLALALSYGRLCRLLALQNYTVICATISMRAEVYAWNRQNLPGYIEVFLDVPARLRAARDPKRYYARLENEGLGDFAGHDQAVDEPPSPDLRLVPEESESPRESLSRILALIAAREGAAQDQARAADQARV